MKALILAISFLTAGLAQAPAIRNVIVTWSASVSQGVIGYNVYRGTSASWPTGSPPLNGTAAVNALTYTDPNAVVGDTYTYYVTAVAAPCTATTPAGTPCGESGPSNPSTTTIPPRPAVTLSVTLAVP